MDQTVPPSVWRGMMIWDTTPVTARETLSAEKGSKIRSLIVLSAEKAILEITVPWVRVALDLQTSVMHV